MESNSTAFLIKIKLRHSLGRPSRSDFVQAQFLKLKKEHIDFVLFSMDSNTTKARNIRAVLLTALYNSVNTMCSYYDNLVQYHMTEELSGEERKKDV